MPATELPPTMTPAMMFAALDAWVKSFDPDACELQIVYRARGSAGCILVPSPSRGDEETVVETRMPPEPKASSEVKKVADAMLLVLGKLTPGAAISGPALSVQVEEETGEECIQTDGTFNRAVKHLKATGKLPDENKGGYRLKVASDVPK